MKITKKQYEKIADCFPHSNHTHYSNLHVLNAILYVAENGCKWRALPKEFGVWHTIYTRMNRWAKTGVLTRVFERLQKEQILVMNITSVSLDSTSIKVHPDGTGALKKGPQAIGKSRVGWTTKLHMPAASERLAVRFFLYAGNCHDAPEDRKLLNAIGNSLGECNVLMNKAYEGDETRRLVVELGYTPVVPPKYNRLNPWEYDKELYKRRNEVECLFRRLKGFRRVFTRYDKLDIIFLSFMETHYNMSHCFTCRTGRYYPSPPSKAGRRCSARFRRKN
jgi:transposase